MKKYIVYDVGGSFIKFALMDQNMIHMKGKVKTPTDSLESFLQVIERIYSPYAGSVEGAAISMPGLIDSDKGYAVHGGSLGYIRKINIANIIEERLQVPVKVENDGKSAALGEKWKGNLRGIKNGVVFILGTGVGGGIIINDELMKGAHFGAGEFSFIRTNGENLQEDKTIFGSNGSTVKIVEAIAEKIGEDKKEFNGEEMFAKIREGNQEVKTMFKKYCRRVVGQLMNIQAILDPELFVIGGGMSADPLLVELLEEEIRELCENDFLSNINEYSVRIERSELGNDANLFGALYQYLKAQQDTIALEKIF